MKKIYVINGKKYEWKLENVHPAILFGIFGAGLSAAVLSFWAFCVVTVGMLG